jgi:lysyl-tRNA synthetase class 2
MADKSDEKAPEAAGSAQSAAAGGSAANLHLDEATGEMVSKSELKKRIKQRELEKRKKEKEAKAPPKPVAIKKAKDEDEVELTPSVSFETRKRWNQSSNR